MESSQFKQLIKEKFDARTEYDKDNNRHPKLAVELVHRAQLQRGWSVFDIACGTGFVTFLAAEKVGTCGAVAGVDLSSVMIQQVILCCNPNISPARRSVSRKGRRVKQQDAGCAQVGVKRPF